MNKESVRVIMAARELLGYMRRRYPGDPLRCPYMVALDEAMRELAAECLRKELAKEDIALALRYIV